VAEISPSLAIEAGNDCALDTLGGLTSLEP
jgi:hypothetical protein